MSQTQICKTLEQLAQSKCMAKNMNGNKEIRMQNETDWPIPVNIIIQYKKYFDIRG